jgi:hypothetical protein
VLLASCANTSRNIVACTGAYYVGAFISTTYISASYADPSMRRPPRQKSPQHDRPCLGHLFLKPGHVSYISGGMLCESKWRGVLGNLEGTKETQVNFFLSLN